MFATAHVIFIEDESNEQEICMARINETLMFMLITTATSHRTQIQINIARSHVECRKTKAMSEVEQRLPCTSRLNRKTECGELATDGHSDHDDTMRHHHSIHPAPE
jgi:hypothetical protein